MNVGENIRRIRESMGVTQTQLAQMVLVTPAMVCQIERGTRSISLQLAVCVAEALGCDVKDFMK